MLVRPRDMLFVQSVGIDLHRLTPVRVSVVRVDDAVGVIDGTRTILATTVIGLRLSVITSLLLPTKVAITLLSIKDRLTTVVARLTTAGLIVTATGFCASGQNESEHAQYEKS